MNHVEWWEGLLLCENQVLLTYNIKTAQAKSSFMWPKSNWIVSPSPSQEARFSKDGDRETGLRKAKKEGGQACANFRNCDTKLSAKLLFEDPAIKYYTPTHNRNPIMFKVCLQLCVENRSQLSWCTHDLQATSWIHLIDPREVSKMFTFWLAINIV